MPSRTKNKPVQPVAPTPPPAPEPTPAPSTNGLPVIYPTLEIDEYSTASEKGPLDAAWWKAVLWWETEPEYQARMVEEERKKGNANAKPQHFLFGDGVALPNGGFQPVHCTNLEGQKVICWNNANNRPYDDQWAKALAETILHGQWAGPHTIPSTRQEVYGGDKPYVMPDGRVLNPGDTFESLVASVNCETVRISRYGRVISGQHEGTAVILADELLKKARADGVDKADKPKYPAWVKYPGVFIETIVCKGCSEHPAVLMTVDYVKPRTVADVFYTSELFRASTPTARRELCRLLAVAVDTLWTRTRALGYRTHPELIGFLDRHPRLLECAQQSFKLNAPDAKGGRRLSILRLSPGQCAGLAYIMGSSGPKTDGDVYRNEEPPSEKNLDWSNWDKQEEFWYKLADPRDGSFQPVRDALGRLVESDPENPDNQGLGGRGPEKLALLASAWERWRDHQGIGPAFEDSDREEGGILCLAYSSEDADGNKLPNKQVRLINVPDFYGIDCPEVVTKGKRANVGPPDPPPPSPEEIKRMYEERDERRRRQNQPGAAAKG